VSVRLSAQEVLANLTTVIGQAIPDAQPPTRNLVRQMARKVEGFFASTSLIQWPDLRSLASPIAQADKDAEGVSLSRATASHASWRMSRSSRNGRADAWYRSIFATRMVLNIVFSPCWIAWRTPRLIPLPLNGVTGLLGFLNRDCIQEL
jgi:hypothetical protein